MKTIKANKVVEFVASLSQCPHCFGNTLDIKNSANEIFCSKLICGKRIARVKQ